MYYYLFYKFYKVAMTGAIKSLSSFYASIGVIFIEICLLLSISNYYTISINRYSTLEVKSPAVLIAVGVLLLIDYLTFSYKGKWKIYVLEFDQLPKKQNVIGSIIVSIVIVMIVSNLIFSFYLISRIDWKLYSK
jgi:hypothetical protein